MRQEKILYIQVCLVYKEREYRKNDRFKKDVKYVKGVGPNRVQLLNKLGIFTLEDLITYYPRTYEDKKQA